MHGSFGAHAPGAENKGASRGIILASMPDISAPDYQIARLLIERGLGIL